MDYELRKIQCYYLYYASLPFLILLGATAKSELCNLCYFRGLHALMNILHVMQDVQSFNVRDLTGL